MANAAARESEPATTTSSRPVSSRAASAAETALRLISSSRSAKPASPSRSRSVENVFAITTAAPARM
jgi:hypothetical protein